MLVEAGVTEPARHSAGFINVTKLSGGRAEIE
jgi:hypothetical protein